MQFDATTRQLLIQERMDQLARDYRHGQQPSRRDGGDGRRHGVTLAALTAWRRRSRTRLRRALA